MVVAEAQLAHAVGEGRGVGEGVAPPSGGGCEVMVQVDEDGAGDVPGGVLIAPPTRFAKVPAHVSDAQLRVADTAGELRGADERAAQMLAHGFAVTLLTLLAGATDAVVPGGRPA